MRPARGLGVKSTSATTGAALIWQASTWRTEYSASTKSAYMLSQLASVLTDRVGKPKLGFVSDNNIMTLPSTLPGRLSLGLALLSLGLALLSFAALLEAAPAKPRARDLAVPFSGTPGTFNAITDVPGV